MNLVEIIQKVLETHRFRHTSGDLVQKCTGCVWVSWNHDQHVAEAVDAAVAGRLDQCNTTCYEIDCPIHGRSDA